MNRLDTTFKLFVNQIKNDQYSLFYRSSTYQSSIFALNFLLKGIYIGGFGLYGLPGVSTHNTVNMLENSHQQLRQSFSRVLKILHLERKEIEAIYFYAIMYGLLMLSLPLGIQSIINFVLAGSFSTSLVVLITAVVLGVLFTGILQIIQMKLNEKIQQHIFVQYAFEFAHRIPRIDLRSVDNFYMPELVNRFFDVISLQKGLSKILLDLPVAMIQIIFGLLLLSFYNAVFIVFGIVLIAILFLIIRFTSVKGLETSLIESKYKYKVAAWLQEMARIMQSVKFARETDIHMHTTDQYVSGYLGARTGHFNILVIQYWALIIFKVIITAAMLIIGAVLLVNQQLNVGQFVAAEIVIITVMASIEKFIVSLDKVYDVLTSAEKLGIVIDKPLEKDGNVLFSADHGIAVEINNLSFGFSPDTKVLENISLDIPPASVVCLKGKEGSGKSTLLRLLTGAFRNFSGHILINNVPLGNYKIESLRLRTGIFLTQQEIFGGSLWDNISLGACAYQVPEMAAIAEKIGLKPFLAGLENGFDTHLDPMGRRLNKATRQKILFLRAISGKPKLLLFEDPWEGLEDAIVKKMVDVMLEECAGATIIVASNHPYILNKATMVVDINLLNKGVGARD